MRCDRLSAALRCQEVTCLDLDLYSICFEFYIAKLEHRNKYLSAVLSVDGESNPVLGVCYHPLYQLQSRCEIVTRSLVSSLLSNGLYLRTRVFWSEQYPTVMKRAGR